MFYYMYQIKNLLNNKIYVGVHKTKSLDDGYMGSGKIIRRAIVKHGISNFSKVILEYFKDAKSMYAKEAEVVNEEFLLREDVYNLRRGGYGGFDYINKNKLNNVNKIGATKGGLYHKHKLLTNIEYYNNFINNISISNILRHKIGSLSGRFSDTLIQSEAVKLSKTPEAILRRKVTFVEIGHQQGSKNSQSGTIWITNGIKAIKIKKTDLIPEGFRKGRKCIK